MPNKKANVKNEKQYEALKDKGMSKERAAKIANSPGASARGGKKSGLGRELEAGRHDRAEEGRRPQGRPRHRAEALDRSAPPRPSGGEKAGERTIANLPVSTPRELGKQAARGRYEVAKKKGIPGRSKMGTWDLIEAIRKAR